MQEIIVKREDIDTYTSIEITDENKLRIQMCIDEAGMHADFALEKIDDLIEAISIMKDRLERKLSNKKDNFSCEIVPAPDFSLIAELTGGKLFIESIKNDSDNVVIKGKLQKNDTPTEQKDVNIVSDNKQKDDNMFSYGGQIADFPIEVVLKILERQVEQGNPRDVSVFENEVYASIRQRGFTWDITQEGGAFWRDILYNKNFQLFFERYPKKD